MAIDKDQLGRGEVVVATMHTHVKALVGPALILILLGAVGGSFAVLPPSGSRGPEVVGGLALVHFLLFLVLIPLLRWVNVQLHNHHRPPDHRRAGHHQQARPRPAPASHQQRFNYERSLTDRMLGCGTLILETAAGEPLRLPDVPDVERVHVTITELLFSDQDNSDD